MNHQYDFSQPARQAPAAIILFLIKFLKVTFRQAWPALIPLLVGTRKLDFSDWYVYAITIGIAVIYLFFSVFSYLRFYYHINGTEIVIKKGVLTRTVINLPFEKIQTIDFKQNILQQVFGVVEFAIDSAGSKKQEVSLTAIPIKHAEALRNHILEEKKQIVGESSSDDISKDEIRIENDDRNLILKLSIPELIKVGITQNHFKSFGLMIAFGFWIFDQFRKVIEENDFGEEQLESTVTNYLDGTLIIWTLVVLFLIIVPFVISLVSTIFRNFDLQLLLGNDGLKLKSGLFNKKQRSTTITKIQTTAWGYNPLQKLLGIFTIKIYPAASTLLRMKNILVVPGCKADHIDLLLETLGFSNKSQGMKSHKISPSYYKRSFWLVGFFPALIIISSSFWVWGYYSLFLVFWPIMIGAAGYFQYKKWRLLVNENVLKIQYGLFGLHHKIIYWHKIQAIKIQRTPFQNRNKLANVIIYQAGHQIKVPYLPIKIANQLQRYALYKIESDEEGWM